MLGMGAEEVYLGVLEGFEGGVVEERIAILRSGMEDM